MQTNTFKAYCISYNSVESQTDKCIKSLLRFMSLKLLLKNEKWYRREKYVKRDRIIK